MGGIERSPGRRCLSDIQTVSTAFLLFYRKVEEASTFIVRGEKDSSKRERERDFPHNEFRSY
jgi:hypothetical protein